MALKANAVMVLTHYCGEVGSVSPEDGFVWPPHGGGIPVGGTGLHFVCADPGPGENSDYFAVLTAAELASNSGTQLRNLVENKLRTRYRIDTLAGTKLGPLLGQSITI